MWRSEFVSHSDKFCERFGAHFAHDLPPVYADRDLAGAQVGSSDLVGEAGDHEGQYFPLSRREKLVMASQLVEIRPLLSLGPIEGNGGVDRF